MAGTGVEVGVGEGVGVAVAVDVEVGVGVEICTEPSLVTPSKRMPLSFAYIAGGSDENPTPASASRHDASSVTARTTCIITPSGIASNGAMLSVITVSISPSVSFGSCLTDVSPNSFRTAIGNVTE